MDPGLSLLQSFTITVQVITFVERGVQEKKMLCSCTFYNLLLFSIYFILSYNYILFYFSLYIISCGNLFSLEDVSKYCKFCCRSACVYIAHSISDNLTRFLSKTGTIYS